MKLTLDSTKDIAQRVAIDTWGPRDPVLLVQKIKGELDELDEAIKIYNNTNNDIDKQLAKLNVEKELGDCLFGLVRMADNLDIDCSEALKMTVVKIQERVKFGITK